MMGSEEEGSVSSTATSTTDAGFDSTVALSYALPLFAFPGSALSLRKLCAKYVDQNEAKNGWIGSGKPETPLTMHKIYRTDGLSGMFRGVSLGLVHTFATKALRGYLLD
eukprot:Trichotokara_eunicae@DN7738_c0_g1_i1.p1